ncbi:hypothetical protein [Streptomyces amakusaensis]|uniref:DUF3558 domain-containing protein n=1 Tax=Streptomyces amakusaensis TaxID=67271 RepID=A0ABW0AM64_9ACTN
MKSFKRAVQQRIKPAFMMPVAALLVLPTSACTAPEPEAAKSYTVPNTLCDNPIEPNLLEPALPPGRKISTKETKLIGAEGCHILVDGVSALSVRKVWRESSTTVLDVSSLWHGGGIRLDSKLTKDRRYAWSAKGGVARVHCPEPKEPKRKHDYTLFATIVIFGDLKAKESETKKLITAYAASVGKSAGCNAAKS